MRAIALILSLSLIAGGAAAQTTVGPRGDEQMQRLRDDLRLTSAQDAAWRAYAAGIAPDSQAEARRRATADLLPTLTTPRRLALIDATMTSDQAEFRRQSAVVTAFYNQLAPDQRRIFDRDTAPPSDR